VNSTLNVTSAQPWLNWSICEIHPLHAQPQWAGWHILRTHNSTVISWHILHESSASYTVIDWHILHESSASYTVINWHILQKTSACCTAARSLAGLTNYNQHTLLLIHTYCTIIIYLFINCALLRPSFFHACKNTHTRSHRNKNNNWGVLPFRVTVIEIASNWFTYISRPLTFRGSVPTLCK
jgi:hypothetical protein